MFFHLTEQIILCLAWHFQIIFSLLSCLFGYSTPRRFRLLVAFGISSLAFGPLHSFPQSCQSSPFLFPISNDCLPSYFSRPSIPNWLKVHLWGNHVYLSFSRFPQWIVDVSNIALFKIFGSMRVSKDMNLSLDRRQIMVPDLFVQ